VEWEVLVDDCCAACGVDEFCGSGVVGGGVVPLHGDYSECVWADVVDELCDEQAGVIGPEGKSKG